MKTELFIALTLVLAGGGEQVPQPAAESTLGFGIINSTVAAQLFPKEEIDPKTSEQVLELIVKIAEHPATWKQIHRVLETLEANNAAYSRRIDGGSVAAPVASTTTAAGSSGRTELSWMNKRVDRLGDKRNDVPDEKTAPEVTVATAGRPSEFTFQQWKEALFASRLQDEETSQHPQITKAEPLIPPSPRPPAVPETKNFEDRLNDIEDELKKLTKINRLPLKLRHLAVIQQENKRFIKSKLLNKTADVVQKPLHPRFQYHKVRGNLTSMNNNHGSNNNNNNSSPTGGSVIGPNFWKRVASLKRNNNQQDNNNQTKRIHTFVAVSLAPKQEEQPTQVIKPCKNKKNHGLWKQKQQDFMKKSQQPAPSSINTPSKL